MKKPALIIGFLMLFIMLTQERYRLPWGMFHNKKLIPTSCNAVLVPLQKRVPSHWKVFCEGNNLAVEVQELEVIKPEILKQRLYRELANYLKLVAHHSPNETLERVEFVRFKLTGQKIELNALTEGKYLARLATLTAPDLIAKHLQATVQVKETIK